MTAREWLHTSEAEQLPAGERVREYCRRLAAEAPPLSPDQERVIRSAFYRPRTHAAA